jgi:4-amino-4-deoxy-L-arabinose transferase-like glycosyltransferase
LSMESRFLIAAVAVVVFAYAFSLSVPLFGDTIGYGLKTVNWMRDNGYNPVPSGSERGEQAMGHPTLFFWLWALLTAVFGHTMWVARLLPAVASFMCLLGMYRLGRHLSCETAGWVSAFALLASPLFLVEMLVPMPESAALAAVIWSVYHYVRKSYSIASLLCALAVALREQAIILAGVFFLIELFHSGFRKPMRLLLFLSPLLIIALTGLANHLANGYFFFPTHLGASGELEPGWFIQRLRFFGTYIMASDYRWLPVTAALAGMLRGFGRDTYTLPFALVLLSPALLFPPERIAFLAMTAMLILIYLVRERKVPGRVFTLFLLMPFSMVMFLTVLIRFAPGGGMDLYRYLLIALPMVILGSVAMLFRHYTQRTALVLAAVFIGLTAFTDRSDRPGYQFGTSHGSIQALRDYRKAMLFAVSMGDTLLAPAGYLDYYREPACGVVDSPFPAKDIYSDDPIASGTSYSMVVSWFTQHKHDMDRIHSVLPSGSSVHVMEEPVWVSPGGTAQVYRIIPVQAD